ncbi:hypothetical protein KCU65_g120, partial [Aureobasidium melanogenum]
MDIRRLLLESTSFGGQHRCIVRMFGNLYAAKSAATEDISQLEVPICKIDTLLFLACPLASLKRNYTIPNLLVLRFVQSAQNELETCCVHGPF